MTPDTAPERVIIAGDWHGSLAQAMRVIRRAALLAAGGRPGVIVHCGDFGFQPGPYGQRYLRQAQAACQELGVIIRVAKGNHDDPAGDAGPRIPGDDPWGAAVPVAWLPRGYRWSWHGRGWLALGGAASVDKAARLRAGLHWWPGEEVTADEALAVMKDGPADVMVSHDCPAGVRLALPPPDPLWEQEDLDRSDAHRVRLRAVVSAVRPRWIVHGHYHLACQQRCDLGYGTVEVTSLDRDGGRGPNWVILDLATMTREGAG